MVEAGIEAIIAGPQLRIPHELKPEHIATLPKGVVLDKLLSGEAVLQTKLRASRIDGLIDIVNSYASDTGSEATATLSLNASTGQAAEWFSAATTALTQISDPVARERILRVINTSFSSLAPNTRDAAVRTTLKGWGQVLKNNGASNPELTQRVQEAVQVAAKMGVSLDRLPRQISILIPEIVDAQRATAAVIIGATLATAAPTARAETTQPPVSAVTATAQATVDKAKTTGNDQNESGKVKAHIKTLDEVSEPSANPSASPSANPAPEKTQEPSLEDNDAGAVGGDTTPTPTPSASATSEATSAPQTPEPSPAASEPGAQPTPSATATIPQAAETGNSSPTPSQPPTEEPTPTPTVTLPTQPPELPKQEGKDIPALQAASDDPVGFAEGLNELLPEGAKKLAVEFQGDSFAPGRSEAVQVTTPLRELSGAAAAAIAESVIGSPLSRNLVTAPEASEIGPKIIEAQSTTRTINPSSAKAFSEALKDITAEGLPKNKLAEHLEEVITNSQRVGSESISASQESALRIQTMVNNGVPKRYAKLYEKYGSKHKISPFILAAQGHIESNYKDKAKNEVSGAAGPAQFMLGTWLEEVKILHFPKWVTRYMPRYAVEAQAAKMARLFKIAKKSGLPGDDMRLALAGYNAGWRNVTEAGGHPSYNLKYSAIIVKNARKMQEAFENSLEKAQVSNNSNNESAQTSKGEFPFMKMIDGIAKGHALRQKYGGVSGKLPASELKAFNNGFGSEKRMIPEATDAFLQMNAAFKEKFGKNIPINTAPNRTYRPLRAQGNGPLAAGKGKSRHGDGTAADLGFSALWRTWRKATKEQLFWLRDNAYTYGFVQPDWALKGASSKYEPWHWEFLGNKAGRQQLENTNWYFVKNAAGKLVHYDGYVPNEQMVQALQRLYSTT